MGLAFRGLAVGKPKGCPARGRLFIRCLVRRRRSSLAIDRTKADSNTTGFSVGRRLLLAPLCTWALVVTAIPVADALGEAAQPQCPFEELDGGMEVFRTTQAGLVGYLKSAGRVQSLQVEQTMTAVDRRHFVERSLPLCLVYQDMPLPIGYDETISAPHMHATCLSLLERNVQSGGRVLDVGSGSGYLTACLGLMVGETGTVLGVEKHPELAQQSVLNIRESHPQLVEANPPPVRIVAGNVLSGVLDDEDPFDAIHVGAAATDLPQVLVNKLKPGGRLIIPVGPRHMFQELLCVDKGLDGRVDTESLMQVRYVPLTHPSEDNKPVSVD